MTDNSSPLPVELCVVKQHSQDHDIHQAGGRAVGGRMCARALQVGIVCKTAGCGVCTGNPRSGEAGLRLEGCCHLLSNQCRLTSELQVTQDCPRGSVITHVHTCAHTYVEKWVADVMLELALGKHTVSLVSHTLKRDV